MSNPDHADAQQDDALAALHGLGEVGDTDESEHEDDDLDEDLQSKEAESRDDAGASSAASGFVGMLAKEGAATAAGNSAAPIPSAPPPSRPDAIPMARELNADELPAFRSASSTRTKKLAKKIPGWYHGAMPVMFTMGAVLLLIGVWAVGGLIYMATTKATEANPGYPLIQRELDEDTGAAAYTTGSKGGTAALAVCVPVAIAMEIMGILMLKQISAAKRQSEK